MLAVLAAHGYGDTAAVLTVLGVRLSTAGVSVALGILFVAIHLRSASVDSTTHFDDIADAYDVQIPESRRHALLIRKTDLMKTSSTRGSGAAGSTSAAGGGVCRSHATLGFAADGIDMSAGQRGRSCNVGRDWVGPPGASRSRG